MACGVLETEGESCLFCRGVAVMEARRQMCLFSSQPNLKVLGRSVCSVEGEQMPCAAGFRGGVRGTASQAGDRGLEMERSKRE